MHLTSPSNSPQPHQRGGSSPESHGQPGGANHYGGEVPALPTIQQALPDVTDPGRPEPPRPPDSSTHAGLDPPRWKRLILNTLATVPERISLITPILSNEGEVEIVRGLCGEDAQAFIDAIYEARFHFFRLRRTGPLISATTPVSRC